MGNPAQVPSSLKSSANLLIEVFFSLLEADHRPQKLKQYLIATNAAYMVLYVSYVSYVPYC